MGPLKHRCFTHTSGEKKEPKVKKAASKASKKAEKESSSSETD